MATNTRDNSCGKLSGMRFHSNLQPNTNWVRIYSGTGDSSTSTDFYGDLTSAMLQEVHEENGRVLVGMHHTGQLEIMPLFTASGAQTAELQLFGLDSLSRHRYQNHLKATNSGDVSTDLHAPIEAQKDVLLGVPYPLAWDQSTPADDIDLSSNNAETIDLSFMNNCEPIPDDAGTTYYIGPRHQFEAKGFWAFVPWVPTVSSGTLVVLARFI